MDKLYTDYLPYDYEDVTRYNSWTTYLTGSSTSGYTAIVKRSVEGITFASDYAGTIFYGSARTDVPAKVFYDVQDSDVFYVNYRYDIGYNSLVGNAELKTVNGISSITYEQNISGTLYEYQVPISELYTYNNYLKVNQRKTDDIFHNRNLSGSISGDFDYVSFKSYLVSSNLIEIMSGNIYVDEKVQHINTTQIVCNNDDIVTLKYAVDWNVNNNHLADFIGSTSLQVNNNFTSLYEQTSGDNKFYYELPIAKLVNGKVINYQHGDIYNNKEMPNYHAFQVVPYLNNNIWKVKIVGNREQTLAGHVICKTASEVPFLTQTIDVEDDITVPASEQFIQLQVECTNNAPYLTIVGFNLINNTTTLSQIENTTGYSVRASAATDNMVTTYYIPIARIVLDATTNRPIIDQYVTSDIHILHGINYKLEGTNKMGWSADEPVQCLVRSEVGDNDCKTMKIVPVVEHGKVTQYEVIEGGTFDINTAQTFAISGIHVEDQSIVNGDTETIDFQNGVACEVLSIDAGGTALVVNNDEIDLAPQLAINGGYLQVRMKKVKIRIDNSGSTPTLKIEASSSYGTYDTGIPVGNCP